MVSPEELLSKAASRRREGWEIMDFVTPDELEAIAARLMALEAALQAVMPWAAAHGDCGGMSDPDHAAGYEADMAKALSALAKVKR